MYAYNTRIQSKISQIARFNAFSMHFNRIISVYLWFSFATLSTSSEKRDSCISTSVCWRNRICKRLSLTFVVIRANLSDNSWLNELIFLKKHNPPLKIILFKQREIDLKIVDRVLDFIKLSLR